MPRSKRPRLAAVSVVSTRDTRPFSEERRGDESGSLACSVCVSLVSLFPRVRALLFSLSRRLFLDDSESKTRSRSAFFPFLTSPRPSSRRRHTRSEIRCGRRLVVSPPHVLPSVPCRFANRCFVRATFKCTAPSTRDYFAGANCICLECARRDVASSSSTASEQTF